MYKVLAVLFALFVATTAVAAPKKWTFIVFLNGDNNLDSFGDVNINQMKAVGSSDDVNIVVLRDRYDQKVTSKIYYVTKNTLKVVKDYQKNIDMGDYKNMVELFKYATENYPAEHYAFDIWNHGGGWGKRDTSTFRNISWDDHSGNSVSTPQLGVAMDAMKTINGGKNVDLLGMDACLMQMLEVVHQVSPSVNSVVASEETEPGNGWDYNPPLAALIKNPDMSALDFGAKIADAYVASSGGNVQQSVIATDGVIAAQEKVGAFAAALARFDVMSKADVQSAMSATQAFAYSDFKDFIDFSNKIASETTDANLKTLALDSAAAVKTAIYSNYSSIDNATGISVWLPSEYQYSSKKDKYSSLTWAQATGWDKFLASLYE